MKKSIHKMLMLVCLLVAVMGLSVVTAHAATVTGTTDSPMTAASRHTNISVL